MKHIFYSFIIFCSFILTANAQVSTTTTTDSSKMSSTNTGKTFGGAGQYSTWSLGVNVGVTSPFLAIGGTNASSDWKAGFGYGVSLRDKIAHSFSLQLDFHGGQVSGDNANSPSGTKFGYQSFSTDFYSGTLTGLVNVASMDFLHRANSVNFYLSTGAGLIYYTPTYIGSGINFPSYKAATLVLPVGGSVKFKLSDALALNVGYTMNFLDDNNMAGYHPPVTDKSHYSYGFAGLEYTFGTGNKPNMDWVNPVAVMYDELYDEALRQEVAALNGRVTNVQNAVNDLKKDSDGDGVSDQFDKCPNTPAGTVVDGSGCPIVFAKSDTIRMGGTGATMAPAPASNAYANIQFEFDSSVLKTSSYPVLDATATDLKSDGKTITVAGYASSEGTAAHNMVLSKDRANSVKTYLVNSGVEARHLKIKAYGETHPVANNSTEEGRILNRRVEFHK
jgi:OOP family OmpA-OmpF porin